MNRPRLEPAIYEATYEGYTLSTDRERIDPRVVWAFLSDAYWSPGIALEVVTRAFDGSLPIGIFAADGSLAAFGRLVTDYATFGYLKDVVTLPAHRRKGLASWLAREIRNHPDLVTVTGWMLSTRDAHGVYEKAGFKRAPRPEYYMTVPKREQS